MIGIEQSSAKRKYAQNRIRLLYALLCFALVRLEKYTGIIDTRTGSIFHQSMYDGDRTV